MAHPDRTNEHWTPSCAIGQDSKGRIYIRDHSDLSIIFVSKDDLLEVAVELHRRSSTFIAINELSRRIPSRRITTVGIIGSPAEFVRVRRRPRVLEED